MPRSPAAIVDELCVLRCQAGDVDAFGELFRVWQPRLLRHAWRLTQNRDAAADVVQDAWLVIVRGLKKLRDPVAFPPWAYQIVSRKCVDWIRRQQRRRATESFADTTAESATSSNDDVVDDLRAAIRQLAPEKRVVIAMFYLDGQSVDEIAAVLAVPSGTVKSRLHSARQHLKQILERLDHVHS